MKGRFVWPTSEPHPTFYGLKGKVIEGVDISARPEVPIEYPLVVVIENGVLESWEPDPSRDLPATTVGEYYVKDRHDDPEAAQRYVDERAKWVQDRANRTYQGYLRFLITGYILELPDAGDECRLMTGNVWGAIREQGNEHQWAYVLGGNATGRGGEAMFGGDKGITYRPWRNSEKVDAHEMGHMGHSAKPLGLRHSNGIVNGEVREYRGVQWMGKSGAGYNGPNLYAMDALYHVHEIENRSAETVYLVDEQTLELAVPPNAHRLVIIRQPTGVRRVAIGLIGNRLYVYTPDPESSMSWTGTIVYATLYQGQEAEVFGRKIRFIEQAGYLAKVEVENQSEAPMHLPTVPAYVTPVAAEPFDDKSGLWANLDAGVPAWSAQGLHVRHLPDRNEVFVAWLTWEQYEYRTVAYTGVLQIGDDNVARGDLYSIGEPPEVVGKAELFWQDADDGIFRAWLDGEQAFATPLERLTQATDHPLAGFWGIGRRQGISLEVMDNGLLLGFLMSRGGWMQIEDNGEGLMTAWDFDGGMRAVRAETTKTAVGVIQIDDEQATVFGDRRPMRRLA